MARLPRKTQQAIESAISECVPNFIDLPISQQDLTRSEAISAETSANSKLYGVYLSKQQEIEAKKAADDQAVLKRKEPALWGELRTCAFEGAARLALVSGEPAEAIVAATFAACRPQRTALIELHKRYGDLAFTDEMMDKVEAGVAGALVLEVIRARAAKAASSSPPLPTPSPSKPEQSI